MDYTKIEAAKQLLAEKGLSVDSCTHKGKQWFQIDYRKCVIPRYGGSSINVSLGPYVLATPEEMEHLSDGVYSPEELLELLFKRQAEERERSEPPSTD
jgi:hypothetical protein